METFLSSEYTQSSIDKALFHIIPVPCEKSVSYGNGTKNGPKAILKASLQLEATELNIAAGTYGFHTTKAINCSNNIENILDLLENATKKAIDNNAIPAILGGEHSISLGSLRAFKKYYKKPFGIVHFDAHADLRPIYEGEIYSHACVMFHVVQELNLPLIQIGTREVSEEENAFRKNCGIISYNSRLCHNNMPNKIIPDNFPKNIYISFDVDCLDSSLMPATGTPSPGGLFYHQVENFLLTCCKNRNLIGFDVVELAPIKNLHHADFTSAKLVHLLMALAVKEIQGK